MCISILSTIGNTPIITIDNIHIKAEFMNPTGSIKDRVAYEMLRHERSKFIFEVSSGNTGISVAFVCSALNKKCVIFCPITTSMHKVRAMKAYGAEVDMHAQNLTESVARAKALLNGSRVIKYLDQFSNGANLQAQTIMAKETKSQLQGITPTAIVCGIGTSGTLAGLHSIYPDAHFFTPIAQDFAIEGISDGVPLPLKPKQCNLIEYGVNKLEVQLTKQILATQYGLWVGDSSAANYLIATRLKDKYQNILVIMADNGWRY